MMVPRSYSYVASSAEKGIHKEKKKSLRRHNIADAAAPCLPTGNKALSTENDGRRVGLPNKSSAQRKVGQPDRLDQGEKREYVSRERESPKSGSTAPEPRRSPVMITSRATSHRPIYDIAPRRFRGKPVSSSSPHSWGMLLTPPEETETEIGSIGSDTTLDGSPFVRSMSKDSMTSVEDDSTSSTSSESLREQRRSSVSDEKRQQWVSTSSPEECALDHPLLPPIIEVKLDLDDADDAIETPVSIARMSRFKSNLTASLRAISSAAKSFSNIAAPAVRRDEYLTRSLLSISSQLTDERRPVLPNRFPDPALRRYLNPTPSNISAAEFHGHRDETRHAAASSGPWKASIQLQPYSRRPPASEVATSPPIFEYRPAASSLDEPSTTTPVAPRQREPRENGDFLRIIVLEMNMRRDGRLKESEPGRAKLWLPARQPSEPSTRNDYGNTGEIPSRWRGVLA